MSLVASIRRLDEARLSVTGPGSRRRQWSRCGSLQVEEPQTVARAALKCPRMCGSKDHLGAGGLDEAAVARLGAASGGDGPSARCGPRTTEQPGRPRRTNGVGRNPHLRPCAGMGIEDSDVLTLVAPPIRTEPPPASPEGVQPRLGSRLTSWPVTTMSPPVSPAAALEASSCPLTATKPPSAPQPEARSRRCAWRGCAPRPCLCC